MFVNIVHLWNSTLISIIHQGISTLIRLSLSSERITNLAPSLFLDPAMTQGTIEPEDLLLMAAVAAALVGEQEEVAVEVEGGIEAENPGHENRSNSCVLLWGRLIINCVCMLIIIS